MNSGDSVRVTGGDNCCSRYTPQLSQNPYSISPRHNMRYLLWFVIWDTWPSSGEWVELPKLNPFQKKDKISAKVLPEKHRSSNESNKPPVTLDFNLEQILLQVHRTLAGQGQNSMDKKENFLQSLQRRILSDIWGRSHNLWSRTGVEARGHGHLMAFPSLEGALMTISFLTFAVFLIKIVKQFIQGLQGNLVGIELPVTMVTPAKVIKHRRSSENEKEHSRIQCSHDTKVHSKHPCLTGQ